MTVTHLNVTNAISEYNKLKAFVFEVAAVVIMARHDVSVTGLLRFEFDEGTVYVDYEYEGYGSSDYWSSEADGSIEFPIAYLSDIDVKSTVTDIVIQETIDVIHRKEERKKKLEIELRQGRLDTYNKLKIEFEGQE